MPGIAASGDQAYKALEQQLQQAFHGEIKRVRKPIGYGVGILLVTPVMVVLPVIYIALIALTGFAVYYHAVNHTGMLEYGGYGRAKIFVVLAYLAPLIIGAILVFFMTKPLLARPAVRVRTRSLTRFGEPLLFDFVERLCRIVGAPNPKRIDVDYQMNASAHFRRGWLSFLGSDLVLTIGVPMAAGLTLREFTGVLAHEFGHFSQGAGMRLTYVARSINAWFARVVYERDEWDEWLEKATGDLDIRIGWILLLSQLFVMASRGVLWALMVFGHSVSGFMLRQMEYDADRYETRVAGSEAFAKTTHRIRQLGAAYQAAQQTVLGFLVRGRFPDDLTRVTLKMIEDMPAKAQRKIDKGFTKEKTGMFDTHPSDRDRIESSKRENAPGIFRAEGPASLLFKDFDALARNVTWDLYCTMGAQIKPQAMDRVEDLFGNKEAAAEPDDADVPIPLE